MNKEAIQKTIDLMKSGDSRFRFDMSNVYIHGSAQSSMCIAGYVNVANGCDYSERYYSMRDAAATLGLHFGHPHDRGKAVVLFAPNNTDLHKLLDNYDEIKIEHGIEMLERLLETGKVDWKPVVEKILAGR